MKKQKLEYYSIYEEFYNENKFRKLKNDIHHGLSRLEHTNRVAKISFILSKKLGLDYVSTTRGALLHDFFIDEDLNTNKWRKQLKEHPNVALFNAKKYFSVNEVEEDIIAKHMFPVTLKLPKYKESLVVSISDKIASMYEFFRYQCNMTASFLVVLTFNILNRFNI